MASGIKCSLLLLFTWIGFAQSAQQSVGSVSAAKAAGCVDEAASALGPGYVFKDR